MKTTAFFDRGWQEPDREMITDDWIISIKKSPIRKEDQTDGRIWLWGRAPGQERFRRKYFCQMGKLCKTLSLTGGSDHESRVF